MASGYRWLLQNYLQTWLNATCEITFNTDIAVHAFLRYTDTPPRMHLTSLKKRGLFLMKDPYYCFVAWQEIEQTEAGDTLSHTFSWPGWSHCLTQWFYFRAEIASVPTPTQWGIFNKHYIAPETVLLFPMANGFEVFITWPADKSIHWEWCRDADTVWVPPPGGGIYGRFDGRYVWVRIYDGYQWFWDVFNLDSLPPGVTDILNVRLYMYVGKVYVYGKAATLLRTHATYYEGVQVSIGGPGLVWYHTDYPTNPFTGMPWTPAEVNNLQAGVNLAHQGTFGMAVCDQVYVQVTHRPSECQ